MAAAGYESDLYNDFVSEWVQARLQLTDFNPEELWDSTHHTQIVSEWLTDTQKSRLWAWVQQADSSSSSSSSGDHGEGGSAGDGAGVASSSSDDPSEQKKVLVFHDGNLPNRLKSGEVKNFCYFFKLAPEEQIQQSTINELVSFGTVNDELLSYLLGTMNSVFVPLTMADHGWADNVRKDFTAEIQRFMATATEMAWQAKGATVLYIPTDSFETAEVAAKDKDLVQRFESTLMHWIRQIKELTVTTQQDSVHDAEAAGPLEEIEFWRARGGDLSHLHQQLQTDELRRVLEVLAAAKSTYLKQFDALQEDIQTGTVEAQENLRFLSILEEPCKLLAKATPQEIPGLLPALLHRVRMIWTCSTHYNTPDRLTGLLRKMSNELIRRCQASIRLDEIFA
eukprot:Cvel_30109.t1-p1 / transcript=Cvel_30109.t1 / gene=Cvel_30109 / organism=Chromera_velia_CCMP2878 / gene_product=Dynein-1-beta heavy chain, flagellar inner arm I1, putative / transcript_product=Dynein-1-beta heavy chain, flagellar inner arm I1, putative / location=Cvel_scaffold4246:346-1927(-) / protein_length=394 / sequence_SO=supercontig / SO=protein_coding / is_pseudo=false